LAEAKEAARGSAFQSMQDVQERIREYQGAMSEHGFLRALDTGGTIDDMRRIAPRVAFFVFAFQDVLRLVHSRSSHPQIKPFAEKHAQEDRGHDEWYLRDLAELGVSFDSAWLFSDAHRVTRDVVYAQITQIVGAKYDQTRLAAALSLEALAAVFFASSRRFLERIGEAQRLDYFGGRHLAAELSHELYETGGQVELASIEVPEDAAQEILTAIEQVFASMTTLAEDLERHFRHID
jgi:hypothetical protein